MPIEETAQAENVKDSIAGAIAALEGGGDTEGSVPQGDTETGEAAVSAEPKTGAARDAGGRFAPKQSNTAAAEVKPAIDQAAAKPADQQAKPLDQQPNTLTETPARPAARGPASWRPEVREKWATLPAEVQQEVMRREREVMIALQESAQARQLAEAFTTAAQPFQHIIAMEGGDPVRSFGDYLKTATLLRSGAPQEKANAVASAIMQFGVDINMLDAALSQAVTNRPMPHVQNQPAPVDPRVDQILEFIGANQQQKAAQAEEQALTELETFAADPKNEFFEDLRHDMADIMRLAAKRGQQVTLADAYSRAAKLHPEISKIVSQREAAAEAARKRAEVESKRRAAGSITNTTPRQTGRADDAAASVRASIERAIEQHSG